MLGGGIYEEAIIINNCLAVYMRGSMLLILREFTMRQ
jgi:hypothetical protein